MNRLYAVLGSNIDSERTLAAYRVTPESAGAGTA
jgi:hypothetical protein